MSNSGPHSDPVQRPPAAPMTTQGRPRVQIYDPPMCCPTGLCGPTVDPVLLDINEAVLALKSDGFTVERYLLNSQPQAFLANPEVLRLVRERQMAVLPVTVVDGRVAKTGAYPSLEEIRQALSFSEQTR